MNVGQVLIKSGLSWEGVNMLIKHIWLHDEVCYYDSYSPAAIIRNAKTWNIILLLAFCPKVKLKSGFRISYSVRKKLVEESTIIALTPNLLAISTFLGFLNLNGVTAM